MTFFGGGFAGVTIGGGEDGGVDGSLDGRVLTLRDWPDEDSLAAAARPGGAERAEGRAALGDPRCDGRGGARGLPVDGRRAGPLLLPGRPAGPVARSTAGFGERLNISRAFRDDIF